MAYAYGLQLQYHNLPSSNSLSSDLYNIYPSILVTQKSNLKMQVIQSQNNGCWRALSCLLLLQLAAAYTSLLPNLSLKTDSSSSTRLMAMKLPDNNSINNNKDEPLISSRNPHKLANGRGTFLGFRSVNDFKKKSLSTLNSQPSALIPDGGLSPCVIRVLGVGGGGCNAVRTLFICYK